MADGAHPAPAEGQQALDGHGQTDRAGQQPGGQVGLGEDEEDGHQHAETQHRGHLDRAEPARGDEFELSVKSTAPVLTR